MPRGDGTGPMGMGSMTGRGSGFCNGFAAPGYINPAQFRNGLGGGFGRGRGFRRMFCATGSPGWRRYGYPTNTGIKTAPFDEKAFLSNQAEFLEDQLQQVKERLSCIEKETE